MAFTITPSHFLVRSTQAAKGKGENWFHQVQKPAAFMSLSFRIGVRRPPRRLAASPAAAARASTRARAPRPRLAASWRPRRLPRPPRPRPGRSQRLHGAREPAAALAPRRTPRHDERQQLQPLAAREADEPLECAQHPEPSRQLLSFHLPPPPPAPFPPFPLPFAATSTAACFSTCQPPSPRMPASATPTNSGLWLNVSGRMAASPSTSPTAWLMAATEPISFLDRSAFMA